MSLPDDYEIPVPDGTKLLNHQDENVRFSASRKVTLIADPPGLGKTFSVIALTNCFLPKRILVICPSSLKINWQREFQKFSIHDHLTIGVGTPKDFPDTDIVILNYDVVAKYHDKLVAVNWDFMVLDEAHFAKNPDAERTKRIFGKAAKRKPIKAIPHKRLILLTGTPMTNRPIDLWQFCQVADPGGLGKDYFAYVKRYCAAWNSPWGLDVSGASNLEELGRKLRQSFMIRHDKGILGLPAKLRTVIELPTDGLGVAGLLKREADLYDRLKADPDVDLESEDFEEQVERLSKQKGPDRVQMMTDLAATRQEVALKKLPLVLSFVDNLIAQDEKVVVFVYHRAVAAAIEAHYGGACVVVTGATPMQRRQDAVDAFQGDPAKTVFIGQIKAAGTGLTLTAGRTVVFAELDYVPGNLEQAEDRVHRISQDRICNAYYLVLMASLDAKIANNVVEKQRNIRTVMGE
jgi:SWI/SNF-related matrix-associated actin-dependent regulator 1 of chromatin subfamily A